MTAGPASPPATPTTMKMPVPMIAPTPSAVRSSAPTERLSSWPLSCVSSMSESTVRIANGPGCVGVAIVKPPLS